MKLRGLLLFLAVTIMQLCAQHVSSQDLDSQDPAVQLFGGSRTCGNIIRRRCTCPSGTTERPVRTVRLPSGEIFCIRLPRLLPNPDVVPNTGGNKQYARTWNDTCGLYAILFSTFQAQGTGPPAHVHFAEDEWWLPTGEGERVRLHAQRAGTPLKVLKPGEIPGTTPGLEAFEAGGVEVATGSIGYSPLGIPHTYKAATNLTNFWAVWGYGRTIKESIDPAFDPSKTRDQILLETGLFGCPSDIDGTIFGGKSFVNNRGPIAIPPVNWSNMVRLQSLFDRGEACYPNSRH